MKNLTTVRAVAMLLFAADIHPAAGVDRTVPGKRLAAIGVIATGLVLAAALALPSPAWATQGDCGDANGDDAINATDALIVLKRAVNLVTAAECESCVCDVNNSDTTNATDALLVLKTAVNLIAPTDLDCPACSGTTTTTESTTTTQAPGASTTLTTASTTTSSSTSTSSTTVTTSTTSTSTTTTPPATTWTEVLAIFAANSCTNAGCHGNGAAAGGLGDLDDSASGHAALVGVDSTCGGKKLVTAGSASASYLLDKLDATATMCGSLMPLGASALSAGDLAAIQSWVEAGADNN